MISTVYNWTLRAPWRTWAAHAALGLALAVPFGAWTVMIFYLLREVEQVLLEAGGKGWEAVRAEALDHSLDFAVPFLVLGLAASFLGL